MATQETSKTSSKMQQKLVRKWSIKIKSSNSALKKAKPSKTPEENTTLPASNTSTELEKRKEACTSKVKQNKSVPKHASVLVRKPSCRYKPKPAHSELPVLDKMKTVIEKLEDKEEKKEILKHNCL